MKLLWENILEALNAPMLQADDKSTKLLPQKRKTRDEANHKLPCLALRMEVADAAGTMVGTCSVSTPNAMQPFHVHLEHVQEDDQDTVNLADGAPLSQMDIQVLPSSADQLFELWRVGIISDMAICARLGLQGLDGFRGRLATAVGGADEKGSDAASVSSVTPASGAERSDVDEEGD